MPGFDHHIVFGPLGQRIVNVAASPNGKWLACHHAPQNLHPLDQHWLLFRQEGDTYAEVGALPGPRPLNHGGPQTFERLDFAPLDDGRCLALETDRHAVDVACFAANGQDITDAARWEIDGTLSFNDAILRLMPSGREALVLTTDQDDKQVDWGGGPPPDYIQTWKLIDLASGETREQSSWVNLAEPILSPRAYVNSRGLSVLIGLGAPPWVGTRPADERAALEKIVLPLAAKGVEYPIRAGTRRLLTDARVIDIRSGDTLLQCASQHVQTGPRFHDLAPDDNHVLRTIEGGHFSLWNVSSQSAWQPVLPAHGGVHTAIFLPGGRAALGTAQGGVIVVDCTRGIAPGAKPW